MQKIMISLFKFGLAFGLIFWMAADGKLRFADLGIFVRQTHLIFAAFGCWLLAAVILGSYRWVLLLRGAGYSIGFLRCMKLQLIGMFFNSAMPGAVSGDLIKVVYIIKSHRDLGKTPALMTIFMDRILGLAGLFTFGALAAGLCLSELSANENIFHYFITLVSVTGLWCVIVFSACNLPKSFVDKILHLLQGLPQILQPGGRAIEQLLKYKDRPQSIYFGWALAVVSQGINFLFFYAVALALAGQEVSIAGVGAVFPIGIAATAIPLTPGGLGVGHVAFETLFASVGLLGGANVFNAFVLSQLFLNLIGSIPFLFFRKDFKQ